MKETGCCPVFDPKPWDKKTFTWKNKRFVKEQVLTFWHIPLNFGSVMRKLDAKIRAEGAKIPGGLCLSDDTSKFNMDVYCHVSKDIPGLENVTISGKFMSKVYEGPYSDTGKWCKDFEAWVKGKGKKIKKWYMWYTTCPKCAKAYGKNYVVIIGQVG